MVYKPKIYPPGQEKEKTQIVYQPNQNKHVFSSFLDRASEHAPPFDDKAPSTGKQIATLLQMEEAAQKARTASALALPLQVPPQACSSNQLPSCALRANGMGA
eukprot:3505003-Amphidinium_carterae.1